MHPTLLSATLAATLSLPLVASAQADPSVPGPASPGLTYRSAFEGLASGVEEGVIPWKDANAAVAEFPRGHADIVRWEARQAGQAAPVAVPASAAASAPSQPGASPGMHHHHHGGAR